MGKESRGINVRDLKYGEVYWIKYGTWPYWPIKLARVDEAPEQVLREEESSKNYILCYFFGSHSYCWVEPTSVATKFSSAKIPPETPKFIRDERDATKVQYHKALTEAEKFKKDPQGNFLDSEEESEEEKEINEEEREEEEAEVQEILSDNEGDRAKRNKKGGNGKEKQTRYATRSRTAESESDDFKHSSGEKYSIQNVKAPRKKQNRTTRKKAASRATRSSKK